MTTSERAGAARPLVSILVKTLNEEANIERCLRSCLAALDGLDGEIIVADSLSDDATVAIASRFPVRVVQLKRAQDRGCGAAAQLAYQYAKGRYLYVIDGDMELPAEFLREAIAVLGARPDVAGVGGQLEELHAGSDLSRIRATRSDSRHSGAVDRLNGGGLYRREAVEQAGGYLAHAGLHALEELELAIRLRRAGWMLWRTETVSMRHAGHTVDAFPLLKRRWHSGYAFGSGELIRSCVGKPHFGAALREFRLHYLVFSWWLGLLVCIGLGPSNPWILLAAFAASTLPLSVMFWRKRSFYLGLYAVVAWHVFAAGAIVGFFNLRVHRPTQQIQSRLVYDGVAGPADHADPRQSHLPSQPTKPPLQTAEC